MWQSATLLLLRRLTNNELDVNAYFFPSHAKTTRRWQNDAVFDSSKLPGGVENLTPLEFAYKACTRNLLNVPHDIPRHKLPDGIDYHLRLFEQLLDNELIDLRRALITAGDYQQFCVRNSFPKNAFLSQQFVKKLLDQWQADAEVWIQAKKLSYYMSGKRFLIQFVLF